MSVSEPSDQHWRPSCAFEMLQWRAQMLGQVREFFAARQVLEVETPLLASSAVSDPHIDSIASAEPTPRWLRTSPEFFHKRLLAAGSGDIYELGKVFRSGEAGRWHNPEFTMLEWYRVGWHYHQLMDEVEVLIRSLLGTDSASWPSQRFSYRQLHHDILGLDPFTMNREQLTQAAQTHGLAHAHDESDATLHDFLYGVAIRAHLPATTLTFVYDFPLSQSALARVRADDPPVAERFELFMGAVEVANGYQELTDGAEQERRFLRDLELRRQHGQATAPLDQNLLAALRHGLPECSGVAVGLDRILAQMALADSLSQVMSFHQGNA